MHSTASSRFLHRIWMRGPPPLPAKGAIAIAGRRGRCRCWKKGAAVAARIRGPPSMPPYSRCRCRKKGLLPLQGEGGRRRCLLVATAAARRRGHRRSREGTAVGEGPPRRRRATRRPAFARRRRRRERARGEGGANGWSEKCEERVDEVERLRSREASG